MKMFKRLIVPALTFYLGGCTLLTAFYATFLAVNPGCHIHLFGVLNIVGWPWYVGLMVVAYCL